MTCSSQCQVDKASLRNQQQPSSPTSGPKQAFAALRAMPQVKRCGYYPEKSAATAARPAAKPAHALPKL
ncbi:Zinc finger transcription factor ace1 [Colletotrichum asianum]